MPVLIHAPLGPDATATEPTEVLLLRVDRRTLARRIWRASASDGTDFGFRLERALRHGEAFHRSGDRLYRIEQNPEPVLVVDLSSFPPSAAAGIGWAVGNLHLDLSSEPGRLLTADEPAARSLFERLNVAYSPAVLTFRPGRFARGNQRPSELGQAHRHE
jgi:urease accessory protein